MSPRPIPQENPVPFTPAPRHPLLARIPTELLGRRRVAELEAWCLAANYRPTWLDIESERARRKDLDRVHPR